MEIQKIYLDFNASTPIAPEVAEAMRPFLFQHFGNPSSHHWAGEPAREAVENARRQVADLLQCHPSEIVFTSGGSESNNHAIKGVFYALKERGNHIITTQIEHPAVLNPYGFLEKIGVEVTYISVDQYERVDPKDIEKAISSIGWIVPTSLLACITLISIVLSVIAFLSSSNFITPYSSTSTKVT